MKSLAMITARGGSKRIPGKNKKEFCGKPILAYSIEAALGSGVFDEVMVSTDDDEIASLAQHFGARVPFRRSARTAGDFATTDEVIAEVLEEYRRLEQEPESFCCIYPTAPFLTPSRLKEAMGLLDVHESVLPVTAFSYPPQRGFVVKDGCVVRWMPQYETARSQDLEKIYHDAGQFYACRTEAFLRGMTTDVADMVPLVLPESEVQDIDTPEDWKLAEQKFLLLKERSDADAIL